LRFLAERVAEVVLGAALLAHGSAALRLLLLALAKPSQFCTNVSAGLLPNGTALARCSQAPTSRLNVFVLLAPRAPRVDKRLLGPTHLVALQLQKCFERCAEVPS
jgi:hypothetical protein